jgi:hypothetical protein
LNTVVKPSRNIDLKPDNSIVGHSVEEPFVFPVNTILLDRVPKAVIGAAAAKWCFVRDAEVGACHSEW